MRFWPRRRARSTATPSSDDLLVTEGLLHSAVEDVFAVRDRRVFGGVIAYRGQLLVAPADAVDRLVARFRPFGFTPFLRAEGGDVVLQALPLAEVRERPRIGLSLLLFGITCCTTLFAGMYFSGSPTFDALRTSSVLGVLSGFPFAATLLTILGVHEFGHYFTARYHKASVSLPYFIPAPPIVGTFGAVIRMRSPVRDRNSLFDIAVAGPLAGLAIAIPAMLVGLSWSFVVPARADVHLFGDSLLRWLLVRLEIGGIPDGMMLFTHPMADAAWIGFLVTAINLFPVGQLDGGRIAYALFQRRHRALGVVTFAAVLLLGVITRSVNWFVWAGLIFFLVGFHHSPPLDDVTPVTRGRRVLGWVCLVLLLLLLPPVPFPGE